MGKVDSRKWKVDSGKLHRTPAKIGSPADAGVQEAA